jgi:REP element-mobilizing transposase RayT
MGEGGYKIRNQGAVHFITFSVVGWIDVFTRSVYRDILFDSIRYCQSQKGLLLHAWCLMTNHIHLLAAARQNNLSDVLRDFKRFTSKQLVTAIENNVTESRRDWMLPIFKDHGSKNLRNTGCQFWRQDNHPEECYSSWFTRQKLNYIHYNPVKAGIVELPEQYLLSSARDYHYEKRSGLLDIVFL